MKPVALGIDERRFDHFGVDLKGNRLFATPEDYKAVVVFDLKTGKLIRTMDGIGRPHAVLYREDLNRMQLFSIDDYEWESPKRELRVLMFSGGPTMR